MDQIEDRPPSYEEVAECRDPVNLASSSSADGAPAGLAKGTRSNIEEAKLPSYKAATTLPSYKEAEQEKEEITRQEVVNTIFHLWDVDNDVPRLDGLVVGNDCYFVFAFIMGFFFNWFGLFIGYFIMFNWAGRQGSFSGFGLSIIKWLILLKYSDCCKEYFINRHDSIWWICCALGFVMFLKGLIFWSRIRDQGNPPAARDI